MQAISDPNGCRQGGVAISMVAIAVFLSVDANFSEKFKVLCVSSFCFTLDLNHTCAFPGGGEPHLVSGVLVAKILAGLWVVPGVGTS